MTSDGQMLFLHRTAGSKMDPYLYYPSIFQPVDYITTPLSPRQAAQVHIAGPMDISKFDATMAGSCTARGLNLREATDCCTKAKSASNTTHSFHGLAGIPLFATADFPGLPELLSKSVQAFRELQRQFQSKKLPLGSPIHQRTA